MRKTISKAVFIRKIKTCRIFKIYQKMAIFCRFLSNFHKFKIVFKKIRKNWQKLSHFALFFACFSQKLHNFCMFLKLFCFQLCHNHHFLFNKQNFWICLFWWTNLHCDIKNFHSYTDYEEFYAKDYEWNNKFDFMFWIALPDDNTRCNAYILFQKSIRQVKCHHHGFGIRNYDIRLNMVSFASCTRERRDILGRLEIHSYRLRFFNWRNFYVDFRFLHIKTDKNQFNRQQFCKK